MYRFSASLGEIFENGIVQNDLVLHNILVKDVAQSSLSIVESYRSLAIVVVELLDLYSPLFNSGANVNL